MGNLAMEIIEQGNELIRGRLKKLFKAIILDKRPFLLFILVRMPFISITVQCSHRKTPHVYFVIMQLNYDHKVMATGGSFRNRTTV